MQSAKYAPPVASSSAESRRRIFEQKGFCLFGLSSIQHSRLLHLNRTHACHDRSLWQMPVANNLAVTILIFHLLMQVDPLGHFCRDDLHQ